jgi:hypothetical protein
LAVLQKIKKRQFKETYVSSRNLSTYELSSHGPMPINQSNNQSISQSAILIKLEAFLHDLRAKWEHVIL